MSAKVNSLIEERKTHLDVVADMSAKLSEVNVLISKYYCMASAFKNWVIFSPLSSVWETD